MLQVEKPEWVPIQVERRGQRQPDTRRKRNRGSDDGRGVRIGTDDTAIRVGPGGIGVTSFGEEVFSAGDPPPQRGGGDANGGGDVSASTGDVNVTVNADVESAVQRAIDDLRRAQERQREELRQDLENEISDLRRQIQAGSQGRGFR